MDKHSDIPAEAIWNKVDHQWELGQRNLEGKQIGVWQAWHVDGHKCGELNYGDGTAPYYFKRFHPDGTIAQEGTWYGGSKWLGTYRWIRCSGDTPEFFPLSNTNVWMVEFDYSSEGEYNAQRFFDKDGTPVNIEGTPLPQRPPTVPATAHWVSQLSFGWIPGWVQGTVNGKNGSYIGDYCEWDTNGTPMVKRVYDRQSGSVLEDHLYENGQLNISKVYDDKGNLRQTLYHKGVSPPLPCVITEYPHHQKDRTTSFFNEKGEKQFSVRYEDGGKWNKRRYYNNTLVYQCIQHEDHKQPPLYCKYFYPDAKTLIEYSSNGNGTGVFKLYDQNGKEVMSLKEPNEFERNQYNSWDVFMPAFSDYHFDRTITDWQAVIENFNQAFKKVALIEKLKKMKTPPHLKTELDKINWAKVETTTQDGKSLPLAIKGMLSDDEGVAHEASSRLWFQIEHQQNGYEATYKVTTVLAAMLPFYQDKPQIQQRLFHFIYDVLSLADVKTDEKAYKHLIKTIRASVNVIEQFAKHHDDTMAIRAQYVLLEVA